MSKHVFAALPPPCASFTSVFPRLIFRASPQLPRGPPVRSPGPPVPFWAAGRVQHGAAQLLLRGQVGGRATGRGLRLRLPRVSLSACGSVSRAIRAIRIGPTFRRRRWSQLANSWILQLPALFGGLDWWFGCLVVWWFGAVLFEFDVRAIRLSLAGPTFRSKGVRVI